MDITKSTKKIFSNKIFNGETVNYAAVFSSSFLLLIIIKQLFKTFIGVSASISVLIAFIVSSAILFIGEKKFVFIRGKKIKPIIQIPLYIFRCAVDFGFYKICDFIFGDILNMSSAFIFLLTFFIAFFFNYYFDRLLIFDVNYDAEKINGGRLYRSFFKNRFVLASMALAILGIGFVYIIYSMFPFGNTTVMRMDLYHQYGPLFTELFDRVVQRKSFLYSWESGGGSSFLGNYFNYLSSPLSAIIFLFDRKDITYAITTLVAVKAMLSAGTFTYYLRRSQNRHSFASAAFGVFYAFSGYFLAYYWNIMWIDGMILLPLIALGIENIINKGNSKCYIISLTLLLFSSYYMGYMACIFSVLYFLIYYFINFNLSDKILPENPDGKRYSIKGVLNNRFMARGLNFAGSSLMCGALCACALIPVYFILQQCSATSDSFPNTFESYFNIFDLISSHFAGLETTIRSSGDDVLPNIYCGMLPVILLPLYFANKDIRLREKALYLIMIIFFVFSFDNNVMNFLWHGLHFPNDLPYRFSYIYVFIILVMAFRCLMHIKAIEYKDFVMTGFLWILVALLYQKNPTNKISEITIYITIAFVIIWTGVMLLIKKGSVTKIVAGITVFAMAFCEVIVADSKSYEFTQKHDDYTAKYDTYTDALNYINETDKSFYRSELCYLDTRMDPCLYGYEGMSTFSSMAYEKYSQNQYSVGMFGNRINSYTYNTQTPVYNAMYNIKYLVQTENSIEPSNDYYTYYYNTDDGKATVYENDYFLPIAFETSSDLKKWNNAEGNPFDVQEDFIDRAAGVSNVFIPCEYTSMECDGIECDEVTENGTYFFTKMDTESDYGTVDINIKAVKTGNLYIYITSPEVENVNYYWNDDEETEYQGIGEPYILDLGVHKEGDEITVSIDCGSIDVDDSYFEIYAYNIDKEVFESAYDMLSQGGLNVTSHTQTKIEGTIDAGFDGYLYTSIPYDEGWSVYIDGQQVKTFKTGDCQLTTTIKKGTHTVTYKYMPKGMKEGALISALSLIAAGAYVVLKRKKDKNLFKLNKNK